MLDHDTAELFRGYFRYVESRKSLRSDSKLKELSPLAFGLEPSQFDPLIQVTRTFSLVPYETRTMNRTRIVVVSRECALALAVVIGLGYNGLAFGQKQNRVVTAEDHFPTVATTMKNIGESLEEFPDILESHAFLRGAIKAPTTASNPSRRIDLSAKPFDLKSFIILTIDPAGSPVNRLERNAHYYLGTRPRIAP